MAKEQFEVVQLGKPDTEYSEHEPDLTFLRILDPDALSTIKAKKSFAPLEVLLPKGYEMAFVRNLHPSPWVIAGAPVAFEESSREFGNGGHVLLATHFTGDADFLSISEADGFDLLRLQINCAQHGFPPDYNGNGVELYWDRPIEEWPRQSDIEHATVAGRASWKASVFPVARYSLNRETQRYFVGLR